MKPFIRWISAAFLASLASLAVAGGAPSSDVFADAAIGTWNGQPGAAVAYAIAVHNAGPDPASNVVASISIPRGDSGSVIFGIAGNGWTCGSVTTSDAIMVSCQRPTLIVGQAPTISITAPAPLDRGTYRALIYASSANSDPDPFDNDAVLPISVEGLANLSATADMPDIGAPEQLVDLDVDVNNAGVSAATELRVDVELPAGVHFRGAVYPDAPWSCQVIAPANALDSSIATCALQRLTSASSSSFVLKVQLPGLFDNIEFIGDVSAIEADPDDANNVFSATIVIDPDAPALKIFSDQFETP